MPMVPGRVIRNQPFVGLVEFSQTWDYLTSEYFPSQPLLESSAKENAQTFKPVIFLIQLTGVKCDDRVCGTAIYTVSKS